MNNQEWQEVRAIFESRGVSRLVAESRPYVPYSRGDTWVHGNGRWHCLSGDRPGNDVIWRWDAGPFALIPPAQRAVTITRDVRGADGLVMYKHPVPLRDRKLTEFPPQLRPTPMALRDGTSSIRVHDHRDPWLSRRDRSEHVRTHHHEHESDAAWDGVRMVVPIVAGLHDNYRAELHRHADMTPLAREEHVAGKQHHGVDTDEEHEKDVEGKYKLPATPLTDVHEPHVHPRPVRTERVDRRGVLRVTVHCKHKPTCASDLEHTVRHLAKYEHEGVDSRAIRKALRHGELAEAIVEWFGSEMPPDGEQGVHFHRYRDKDHSVPSYGKRIDIHPLAVPLLKSTRVAGGIVWVSAEGNLKADSILTDILARKVADEAVVNIPSVGQWRAEELDNFAKEWLHGCMVVLMYDSDWSEPGKFDVQRQAFAFREYLRRRVGKHAVHVAAPPPSDEKDEWGEPVKVGCDDWLGHGGALGDLVIVERETAPKMREWCEDWAPRKRAGYIGPDRRERGSEARLMELMALISTADGRGASSVKALSAFTSLARNTVSRAFDALAEVSGALSTVGAPLEWVERLSPSTGYRGSRVLTTSEDGGPLESASKPPELQDTLEWQVADGFRWRDRDPRRTVSEVLGRQILSTGNNHAAAGSRP